MNKTLRTIFLSLGAVVLVIGLLFVGGIIGRATWTFGWIAPGQMMNNTWTNQSKWGHFRSGPMMGNFPGTRDSNQPSFPNGRGFMGPGMMDGEYGYSEYSGEPLSIEEAEDILTEYVNTLGADEFLYTDIMIFDNHAYAQIIESESGIGVMEVLIDPATKTVYPEHGPNMMWNSKYGMMGGQGMGMMGQYGFNNNSSETEMSISPEEAVEIAQEYLARYAESLQADEHATTFYGYYTIHTMQDGEIIGMLSVNGYSGEVFLHTWHGTFIEMQETDH